MKELSIFIDESGNFGKCTESDSNYIVSLVFHEQDKSINEQISLLDNSLAELGFHNHTIHTAPLIRREEPYENCDISIRHKIFYKLFNFTRHVNISYATLVVDKHTCKQQFDITRLLAKQLSDLIKENLTYFTKFDKIIVYYDHGQYQLSNILVAIFTSMLQNCYFKKVHPSKYKLFQTADLLCTLTLLKVKLKQSQEMTKSEKLFFGSVGKLKKTYLKYLDKIKF